jgi:hypothetical protein
MKPHFIVCEGDLFDTRKIHWSHNAPLRRGFKTHSQVIDAPSQLKAALRAGSCTDVGGYPLYFICDDGESLCFACARKELRHIIPSIANQSRDGWRVVATDINYEDNDLICSNCKGQIESAYGGRV